MAIITKVQVQVHNKERYSIFLDGEYGFSVSEDVLVKYSLLKGSELDSEFIERVLLAEEKSKARNTALRYLGHRMRSKKEVRVKLVEKGFEDSVDETLDYLEENKYLDESESAQCLARDKSRLGGFGRERIALELAQKGIARDLIAQVLEEEFEPEVEYLAAMELAQKKLNGSYRADAPEAKYRKLYAFLYRKGYSIEIVKSVLKEIL